MPPIATLMEKKAWPIAASTEVGPILLKSGVNSQVTASAKPPAK